MLALLIPLVLATPQSVDHSVMHPVDSLVYFEMADVQGVYRAYEGTAYGQALGDSECQSALEKLLKEEEGALGKPGLVIDRQLDLLTEGYWGKLKPVLSAISKVSASVSLHDMTPQQLVAGMEQDSFWSDDTLFTRLESALRVQIVVDFMDKDAAGMAFKALGQAVSEAPEGAGVIRRHGEYQSHPVARISVSKLAGTNMPAGVFQDGPRLVFVMGADPIQTMEAGDKRTDKLSSAQRFQEGVKKFETQSSGLTVFQFQSKLAESFYNVCPEKEYIQPIVDLVAAALGPDLDMLVRGGDWRVQLRNGDTFVTESFQKDLKLGPFDRLFSGKALNAESLNYVNPEAVLASGISVDTQILVGFLESIFTDLGEDPWTYLRETHDFRPEEDLLANLGSTWVASLPLDSIGVTSLPGLSLWIDLKDGSGFKAGMEKLVQVVNAEAKGEFSAKGKNFRKHRLYTFKMVDARGPEAMLQPTVVIFENRILVSVSRFKAQKEIKRALAAPGDVALHSVFNSSAPKEGSLTVDISYADWGKVLGRLYTGAKGFLPLMTSSLSPAEAEEIPVDLTQLPNAELFTQFFKPATRYRVRVDGGVVMHSESSFGPEMSGVIASSMLTGLFFSVGTTHVHEEEIIIEAEIKDPPVEVSDPEKSKDM
ncbi:MAG: hypothetical protein GY930_05410 [bacterium]|nr:hypothetical protein [bacterium]